MANAIDATLIDATTSPLPNGAQLPEHPANTTALRIVEYGKVYDADDGRPLRCGLHQNEVRMLQMGSKMALGHLYAYVILNKHVYHTRQAVVIDVKCVPNE